MSNFKKMDYGSDLEDWLVLYFLGFKCANINTNKLVFIKNMAKVIADDITLGGVEAEGNLKKYLVELEGSEDDPKNNEMISFDDFVVKMGGDRE